MTPWTIWFKTDDIPSWQPLDSCRSLPVGHYRLAARLAVPGKYMQWRWKFFSATGKVENHDFQGRTNQDGLISLLDLHTVQPGTWQLSAQPDLFDHLCGETWQIRFQFQIVTPAITTVTVPKLNTEPEELEPEEEQSVTDEANNAIVPHPKRPMVVPELDPEPVPVLQWYRKARVKLTGNGETEPGKSLETTEVTENRGEIIEEQIPEPLAITAPTIEKIAEEKVEEPILEPVLAIAVNVEAGEEQIEEKIKESVQEEMPEALVASVLDVIEEKEEVTDDKQPEALVIVESSTDTDAEDKLEKSEGFNPFRSVSYSVELIYPELENPIQVDITVMVDENRPPVHLDLPDPSKMVSLLHRRPRYPNSPLPPRLTSA
ncbi:hypothetical protein [Synechocystis sp. CACIAM 05]|uniref:hypothetical protein n=1 Tax=Synechocystis sp. CACIAM 05 TaxID=1933929 RepID=UPI00138E89FE|nr:hypothetical protein [Synechocystis sp. CACIAM 05]QHV00703.1 hypothetical protein BWK47_11610 [Synechocystis sp. CACIAM 05]